MLRTTALGGLILISAMTVAQAQPGPPPTATPPVAGPESPPAVIAPAAPAFKVGDVVTDRAGVPLGPVKSLTDAPRGTVVIVQIDGKLVAIPQSTLTQTRAGITSRQTKAEILAAAAALP